MQITPMIEARLQSLVDLFLIENAKVNLSALRTPEQCYIGNVLDSLPFLDLDLKLPEHATICDIGTGGGFPLLPIALLRPEWKLIGIDATQKKIDAVRRIADGMQLKNVELISGRAEALGHDPLFREQCDVVTARAVAPVNVLLEYTSPFVKIGGRVILWKSLRVDQELDDSLLARAELSCHLIASHRYTLPADYGERQLLVFEKSGKLPAKYPRAVGVPGKKPIQ